MPGRIQFLHDLGGRVFGRAYYQGVVRAKLRYFSKSDPILVWQMGKVGSSTVLNSLNKARLGAAVFHVHLLNDALLQKGELFRKSVHWRSKGYLYNGALSEQLLHGNKRWKIIPLVRDAQTRSHLRHPIGVPRDYLERMYESNYTKAFYTQGEIKDVHAPWETAFV